tara:strand:+ start:9038 stop:10213 length:1176 start_codon:yes stop_codon:yes gene_type:complete
MNMKVHEYQAKELFRQVGIRVPQGKACRSVDEAINVYSDLSNERVIVKAQVHAGGRGKAGGVRVVEDKNTLADFVKQMLGSQLVTYQNAPDGQPVNQVLIEEPCDIESELYLSAIVDRNSQRVVFMASSEGGVEIETVAENTPEKIFKFSVETMVGVVPYQCREMAFKLGLTGKQIKQFTDLVTRLYHLFVQKDLSMVEVNPLVIDKSGDLVCLDGKINVDDNALYRQPELREYHDSTQEDELENRAQQHDLSYISLDGSIGCMVNGAGLAMATMDLIKLSGGEPANFLDVGGSATKERVKEAFKIILADPNVKAILVNIFGGIVRCDLIADGIISAVAEIETELPVIVRLEGHNATIGNQRLEESGLNIIACEGFAQAAASAVKLSKGEK